MTAIEMVDPIAQEFMFPMYQETIGNNKIEVVVETGQRQSEEVAI